MRAVLPGLVIAALLAGCAGKTAGMTDQTLGPSARVTYEFRDSSVPPPYHRSYVLTFDDAAARIVVDSYGEVLADRTATMTADAWRQVSGTFPDIRGVTVADPEQGCTGGTSFAVRVVESGEERFAVRGLNCGGVNSETAEKLASWVRPVRELFPPMNQLAPEGG